MVITEQLTRIKSLMLVNEQVSSNNLRYPIEKMIQKGGIDVNSLGKKFSPDLQIIQRALISLGFDLPRFGPDGYWGQETLNALRNFNSKIGKSGSADLSSTTLESMLNSFSSVPQKINNNVRQQSVNKQGLNINTIDLSTKKGYKLYSEICQRFIDKNQPNPLGITGDMLADSARNVYTTMGSYIPPEIALAQLVQEGGIRNKNINSKPIRTKNPYNVGNWDKGKTTYRNSVENGIESYYNTMAKNYLLPGSDPVKLLHSFTNQVGNRYASGPNYEKNLRSLAKQINNISNEVLSQGNFA